MSKVFFPDDRSGVFESMPMPADFSITWAGSNPYGEGFCFGSETGGLVFTDTKGNPTIGLPQASAAGEAINGVAFSRNWLAVTTRKDINLIPPPSPQHGEHFEAVVISGGALDVTVSPSGYFIVPLGRGGIMFLKPGFKEDEPVPVSNAEKHGMNFCRVIALQGDNQADLIVGAARRGGIGFVTFQEGIRGHMLNKVQFPGIDFVDVCSLGVRDNQRAIAAAGKDGSLVLFRDILTDKNPLTLKFKSIEGTVYRIRSMQNDIFLLTTKGLFALFGLGEIFQSVAAYQRQGAHILKLPIEAVDANLVDQRWLLAVGADSLFKFDISNMPKSPEQYVDILWQSPGAPEDLNLVPQWEQTGFEQSFNPMALGSA